jgi:hypothetical protein
LWDFADVNRQLTIRRLLAILMIAGLVLAPLSTPVMAGAASDSSMSAMADDMSMSAGPESVTPEGMAADMPCCPPTAPMPIGCDKCIFMADCMSQYLVGMTMALFQPLFAVSTGRARPQN